MSPLAFATHLALFFVPFNSAVSVPPRYRYIYNQYTILSYSMPASHLVLLSLSQSIVHPLLELPRKQKLPIRRK